MSSSSAAAVAYYPSSLSKQTLRTPSLASPLIANNQKLSAFHGLSLREGMVELNERRNGPTVVGVGRRGGLQVNARTAASKTIEVEVDKPLGLTLGQKPGGGVVITAVEGGGNAAKAGLKSGDQVLYTSSFFGDELWPADKLGFTKTAIQAKPDSVYFVISRGAEVDVKRLPKRPAPPRFGRSLTEAQKARTSTFCQNLARATHICLDCGFIYTLQKPFDEQASISFIFT
ncbi:uncharacterized protein M6B38_160755 [Iris pallida]|uniref:PDZ domain-containing protein n=1 Tax=Iris pallida TaxID=29817 RepID=A0AAX6EZ07_IRIPA|nr:Uncharacterized protein M6B38_224310 [Iris pallida]KAJ6809447.1 uncharacterized protein M6B38_160750 [Iris pallida]KAJ6809448.1 uncharacterized protein M6B38_160755 [Iris pallida]